MTPPEYIQLKAFARIDGALLSVIWTCSFACYIVGLTNQTASLAAIALALSSPFFVAYRLIAFRDTAREGIISFMRSWAYVILVFFYGSLIFALVVFAYFAYLDNGYFLYVIQQMINTPEIEQMLKQHQMEEMMGQLMADMSTMRPIDIAINLLTSNILLGIVVGVPIAAILRSSKKNEKK